MLYLKITSVIKPLTLYVLVYTVTTQDYGVSCECLIGGGASTLHAAHACFNGFVFITDIAQGVSCFP